MSTSAHYEHSPVWAKTVVFVLERVYFNFDKPGDTAFVWGTTAIFSIVATLIWDVKWLMPLTLVFVLAAIAIHAFIWHGSYRAVLAEQEKN